MSWMCEVNDRQPDRIRSSVKAAVGPGYGRAVVRGNPAAQAAWRGHRPEPRDRYSPHAAVEAHGPGWEA